MQSWNFVSDAAELLTLNFSIDPDFAIELKKLLQNSYGLGRSLSNFRKQFRGYCLALFNTILGIIGGKKKTIPDSNQGPLKPSYLRTPADKNLTSEAEEDRVSHSAADFDHLPEKIQKMKPWQ